MSTKIQNHKQCPRCRAKVVLVEDTFGQVVSLELVVAPERLHRAGKHGHMGKGKRGKRSRQHNKDELQSEPADPAVRAAQCWCAVVKPAASPCVL